MARIQGNPTVLNGRNVAGKVRADFKLTDFISADVALKKQQWNPAGYYQVKADEARMIGNSAGMMDSATARMYGILKDGANAEFAGKIKFVVTNSFDQHMTEYDEIESVHLNTSATDVTKQLPLPETGGIVTQDRRIWLWVFPDTAADVTLSKANSKLQIPGTRFNLK